MGNPNFVYGKYPKPQAAGSMARWTAGHYLLAGLCILITVFFFGFLIAAVKQVSSDSPLSEGQIKKLVLEESRQAVLRQLKAPRTAVFNPELDRVIDSFGAYRVKIVVDAQNSYGALIRSAYEVEARFDGEKASGYVKGEWPKSEF